MCSSSPDIPPPPPPPQELKAPDTARTTGMTKRKNGGMAGGTLLTGPSGIAGGSKTGGTLLGG